jgi:hypothetical protein
VQHLCESAAGGLLAVVRGLHVLADFVAHPVHAAEPAPIIPGPGLVGLLLAGAGIYLGLYFLHGVLQMAVDQLQVAPRATIVSNGGERETHRMAMRYQVYSSIQHP